MKKIFIALMGIILASSSLAGVKEVKELLQSKYPKLKIESVDFVPDVNLYEALIVNEKDQKVPVYTNDKIDFLVLTTGEILSPKTKLNITIDRQLVRTKAIFDSLPFKDSFSIRYGKGTRKIAVFSDPDCPFCQQMDQEWVKELKEDVTVYYFMNPLTSLHPDAAARAKRILCDGNPSKAWSRYVLAAPGLDQNKQASWVPEKFLPNNDGSCSRAALVGNQYDLATKFGFNSTPTIMFDNGYIIKDRIKTEGVKIVLERRKP